MATDIKSTHPLNDPKGLTTKVSPLTDGYIPYHVDDKTGFADGPTLADVNAMIAGRYRYAAAMADTTTVTLPTITANYPAHGFIHCAHASTGVISESAEFEFGSDGHVDLIRGTANIEANGATAGKISIGAAAHANPVVVKNNLGGGVSVNVMLNLWYG